ncbi:hypothetical protein [Pleionea litopenaei]|uniref:Uncharacterized protein n=1 Tax=Pleionea litopenaei TaxID=3070815 RepID=A0AA51RTE3_9GAMM|nr:hypothetical protein [Pleionea sp. HL-JVS1]WMS87139.1 hypothetical protein Q9312_18185 [Pleionea sp. HL-JVS1]
MSNQWLLLWSDHPTVSVMVWFTIIVLVLYLGRHQAHNLLSSIGQGVYSTMRLWSFTLRRLEQALKQRNREVLLAEGARACEKSIEREFERVNDLVKRELSQYPTLHREISEAIESIENDYQKSSDITPLPPAWGDVVETITALPNNGDSTVNRILSNIKKAVEDSHQQTLKAYKKAAAERHQLLASMQPNWRKLNEKMGKVNEKITGLDDRSNAIDEQMKKYEAIRANSDSAFSALSSSALTQFFISGLVLVVAILGGLINFQLIAMPMSEMVGGTSYIGAMKTSDIAALVIILIEIAMGLFLLESLRVTHLFPMISSMDDRMRKRMMIVSFSILFILAGIEASLAYMRDLLALDREALQQSLSGMSATAANAEFRWIPSIGQMTMGFILPFALAFIAIPLESFIHSLRSVLSVLAIGVIRSLQVIVRIFGGIVRHTCNALIQLYDLVIMLPISIERLYNSKRNQNHLSASSTTIVTEKKSSSKGKKNKRQTMDDDLAIDTMVDNLNQTIR